jgi:TRAP-type C4-dicarboxylate transport system permease small subunit
VLVRTAGKLGIVALLALALFVLPGGGAALNIALTALTIAFFVAIALLGYRLYHEHHFDLDSLGDSERLVLYGAVGVAFLTFTATNRLFDEGGIGVLAWLAVLGLCSYGIFWVWTRYRSYG